MVYLCVITGFTLPLYEACLTRKPKHIVLVISQSMQSNAELLIKLLKKNLPASQLHIPPTEKNDARLTGDDFMQDSHWTNCVLRPFLEQPLFASEEFWLNLNGGTKAMSQVLTSLLSFDYFDYRANGKNTLTACTIDYSRAGKAGALSVKPELSREQSQARPIDIAQLYNASVTERSANPLRKNLNSTALAQELFTALENRDPELLNLFKKLDEIWSHNRNTEEYKQKKLELPLKQFSGTKNWLDKLSKLSPEVFFYNEHSLSLPGNNCSTKSPENHFKRWLSGDWLEQLTHHWLLKLGIKAENISGNLIVESEQGESASGHEADLLVHHQGRSTLIEIKADLPSHQSLTKLADEFNGNPNFGKVNKILMLGPVLANRLTDKQKDNLHHRCTNNQIKVAFSKADLATFF